MNAQTQSLVDRYSLVIKIINHYDGLQTCQTPVKLFKDVLNPEKNKIKAELKTLGIHYYKCEHGNDIDIEHICNCANEAKYKFSCLGDRLAEGRCEEQCDMCKKHDAEDA